MDVPDKTLEQVILPRRTDVSLELNRFISSCSLCLILLNQPLTVNHLKSEGNGTS